MSIKVSVVVATYNAPAGLDDLIASLDAQTLPADEFEMVFVDDGSSDDTLARLHALAAGRPHMVVTDIPNSGWPGRPRNVGTARARGEYVFFADHDDYLFPEALERMHRFAVVNDLDLVHPKEVVKGWNRPGWVAFREHLPRVEHLDQVVLQCITPHKLYRRSFLEEKHVRFPEGRVRLEDFSFNGAAWARTDAIGVLADYPCYQWIIHEDNSHKAGYDFDVYWQSFRDSIAAVLELPEGDKKDQLLIRWYKSRVLERVKTLQDFDPGHVDRLMAVWAELLPLFPPHLDDKLTPADRPRSVLLRQDARDALLELSDLDRGVRLQVSPATLGWEDGRLRVRLVAHLVGHDRKPLPLRVVDGRVLREVPMSLEARTNPRDWDLTRAIGEATSELVLRSRSTSVDWILTSPGGASVEGDRVVMHLDVAVDPGTAACGGPLADEVYDAFIRVNGIGLTPTQRVPVGHAAQHPALVNGRAITAFDTKAGNLALDLSGQVRDVVGTAAPAALDLVDTQGGTELRLRRMHVAGRTSRPVNLVVGDSSLPAELVGADGVARVVAEGTAPRTGVVRVDTDQRRGPVLFRFDPTRDEPPLYARVRSRLGRLRRRARRR